MSDIFLVRQPIFDKTESAVGYELRYRESRDGDDALLRSCLNGSVDMLRRGQPAWVYPDWRTLDTDDLRFANSAALWAVIPPDITADASFVEKAKTLAERGVTLVLDEFERPQQPDSPVFAYLRHAQVVRFDMRTTILEHNRTMLAQLHKLGKRLAAAHIFDARDFAQCRAEGFDYFQGHHFARPEPLPSTELPMSSITALRVMALARDPDMDERNIENAIASDPAIALELLRIVNSAATGGRGIASIGHALRLAGRQNLVRWLSIAAYASHANGSGVADELSRQAVQRGFFLESLAVRSGRGQPGTAFLVGLFSLLDAVFRVPLADVLQRVNLSDDVREALVDRTGDFAPCLELIESYELGLWDAAADAAQRAGVDVNVLPELYAASLSAAAEAVPDRKRAAAA